MHSTRTVRHRIARHGAQLLALGATAALVAGCGAGTDSGGSAPADDSQAGGSHAATGAQSDVRAATQGEESGATLPEEWAGTISTQPFAPESPSSYLAMVTLHGDQAVHEMSAEEIEGSEFLAGADPQCEGVAVLDGDAAHCTFTAMDGSDGERSAEVRLVHTGFGNTALLFGVTETEGQMEGAEFPVAAGAPVGLQTLGTEDVSAVTDEDLADAATSAVMLGYANDGELPEELTVDCEVADGGEHGQCELTGTPDGGGDGSWYATAQHGYDGDRAAYLFTQLPQG